MSEENKNNKIRFADLDIVLKIAPIIGLAILTYLQTLFPSKTEFDKLDQHLIQMDKKISEMNILHNKSALTEEIKRINERLRTLEIQGARHTSDSDKSSFNWGPNYDYPSRSVQEYGPRNNNSNKTSPKERREKAARERAAANKKKNSTKKNTVNRNKNSNKKIVDDIINN